MPMCHPLGARCGWWEESSHEMWATEPDPEGALFAFMALISLCGHTRLSILLTSSGPVLILVHTELI